MSKSTYPLKLPNSVKEAAAELAKIDGVSLNQFIASAVAEKETESSFDGSVELPNVTIPATVTFCANETLVARLMVSRPATVTVPLKETLAP